MVTNDDSGKTMVGKDEEQQNVNATVNMMVKTTVNGAMQKDEEEGAMQKDEERAMQNKEVEGPVKKMNEVTNLSFDKLLYD